MNIGKLLKIFGMLFFVIFSISFSYLWAADANNDTNVQNAARNAMVQAINKGYVRVNEEITINPRIAEEALLRQYAETANFEDGQRTLNIKAISSKPAMIAVESYNSFSDVPILKWFKKNEPARTREMDIVIFEAKKTTK
jgi:hypothetical protein